METNPTRYEALPHVLTALFSSAEAPPRLRPARVLSVFPGRAWEQGVLAPIKFFHSNCNSKEIDDSYHTLLGEQPLVELRVVVGLRPGVVARIGINGGLDVPAHSLESLHHSLGAFQRHDLVFGTVEYPGRNIPIRRAMKGSPPPQIGAIAANRSGVCDASAQSRSRPC